MIYNNIYLVTVPSSGIRAPERVGILNDKSKSISAFYVGVPHCGQILHQLSHKSSPKVSLHPVNYVTSGVHLGINLVAR